MLNRIKTGISITIFSSIIGIIGYHAEPVNQAPKEPKMDIVQTKIYRQNLAQIAHDIEQERLRQNICMYKTVHGEGSSQSKTAREALASVILNRKESRHYPDTICEVVHQYKQFSMYNKDKKNKENLERVNKDFSPDKEYSRETMLSIHASMLAMSKKSQERIVPTYIMNYTTNDVNNQWTKKMKVYTVIDDHKFMYMP